MKVVHIFLSISLVFPCLSATYTVSKDSPADFNNIQAAINFASEADTIVIMEGTYYENIQFKGIDITVKSSNPDDPCVVANTIIDGNQLGSTITFDGNETPACILSGLSITGGTGTYHRFQFLSDFEDVECGGGIYGGGCYATIINCQIYDNSAEGSVSWNEGGGAGIAFCNGEILLCKIFDNFSWGFGGGIAYCDGLIEECVISNNVGGQGGGGLAYCDGIISNCTITGNLTYGDPGGGGFYGCDGIIDSCWITNNSAGVGPTESDGGGFSACNAIIKNCVVRDNYAGWWGGAFINCHGPISNCIVTDNYAEGTGGAFYYCSGEIKNCLISYNYTSGEWVDGGGGGFSACDGNIINCTITHNVALGGNPSDPEGADYTGCGGGIYDCLGTIKNCIIWGNSASIEGNQVYASSDPNFSCIQDWFGGGIDNISTDPCFADLDSNNFHLKSVFGRWEPDSNSWVNDSVTSPCIDTGDPNIDWTNELWPHGMRINMGAYGGTAEASMSPLVLGNPADLNHDGVIDIFDLDIFCSRWPLQEYLLAEDINRNGSVAFEDFSIISYYWNKDISGLVGYWRFDDSSGTIAKDASGYNNNGLLLGDVNWTTGKINGALSYDSNTAAVEVGMADMLTDKGTISLWAYAYGFTENHEYLFGHAQTVNPWTNRIQLYVSDSTGRLDLGLGDNHHTHTNFYTLQTGQWYHIVLVWNDPNYTVYIDGEIKATGTYSGLNVLRSFADIGNNGARSYSGEGWNGKVDDVRLYRRALTEREVKSLFMIIY